MKPALQHILEAACAAMDLDEGRQRLELLFIDGELTRWWAHAENKDPMALRDFEARADWAAEVLAARLLQRTRDVRRS